MPSRLDPAEMPRLDAFDEEFEQDPANILRAERRGLRLLSLVGLALGAGVIGALALAWSTADGRLRAGAAIGRHVAAQRGARRAGRGNRSSPAPARRAEERRHGAHGSAASGGPYHRGDEGGRGGLATPCSAP